MKRRELLKTAATGVVAAGSLAAPRIAAAQGMRTLRFVPQANLSSMDAVAGTQYVVRNAAMLVWETLYGVDSRLDPKPQMCEGHEASEDFRTWTFKLRPGLKFHDGETVTTRDVVASLQRWMVRDTMGQAIKGRLDALEALDDRTFRFRLNKPFPKMLFALGKSNAPVALIMPERIARTDPFKLITEYTGSGPMRFNTAEWVPGSKAVFEKFADYPVRPEAGDWLSGGKRMLFDRIEWQIPSDAATAAAALQNGEVDWVETPLPDLVPLLKRNRNLAVDIADPLGNIGSLRFNHLQPPFNDVRARRAVMMALSQQDYMQAVVGDNSDLWKPLPSFFTPGTAFYTEEGGDILKGPRDVEAAKKLLGEAGLLGAKVTLVVAMDVAITKAEGEVTGDLLKKLGFDVDFVATDWGTVGARRTKKDPPSQGGWNIFHTWHAGADCINPAPYTALDAGGDKAWFGWPKSDEVQAGIAAWYDAPDAAAEKKAMAAINKASFDNVTYGPTGFFLMYQAWRTNVSGVVKAPFPVFWGVQKT
ncbi:ABC transporter substrate-binding protein [Limobrevibacterium gyesilva]|uniref:ABC transporter substrate-binding protein n=1 Tax=Limobrevibacterium gyesilva TaxID=2991712 RepID=A0AA41YHX5_9PROT|nr:ABC transporter substrate-binding protein [Limobrevibacterium gyesilva]MCW3473766.1 ABC transporter substrate-binding protein [Limobrevibacterium gyesilva]